MSNVPKCDLRKLKTPAAAAKRLKAYLIEHHGASESDLILFNPKQEAEWAGRDKGETGVWRLIWEGGPFEWGVRLSMGCSIYECNGYDPAKVEVLHLSNRRWFLEPYYSFDVGFPNV